VECKGDWGGRIKKENDIATLSVFVVKNFRPFAQSAQEISCSQV